MVTDLETWGYDRLNLPLGKTYADQPVGRPGPLQFHTPRRPNPFSEERARRSGAVAVSTKGYKDKVPGGKADKSKPSDFDPEQLRMGIEIEKEHTGSEDLAREIAMDHLKEHPRYYTLLKKMEKQFEDHAPKDTRVGERRWLKRKGVGRRKTAGWRGSSSVEAYKGRAESTPERRRGGALRDEPRRLGIENRQRGSARAEPARPAAESLERLPLVWEHHKPG